MISTWMLTALVVVVILMTPALLQKSFGLPAPETQLANLAATAGLVLSAAAVGATTDWLGVRRVAILVLPLLIVATYGVYLGAERMPSLLLPLYLLAGIGAGGVSLTPIIMIRAFPPRVASVSFLDGLASKTQHRSASCVASARRCDQQPGLWMGKRTGQTV
jgi:Na+/melibiose symporter-like transporter